MRIVRFVCWLALPAALLVGGMSPSSAEVSAEVQQACTPDAMRLCSEFIPDRAKITACMIRKRRELSEACLTAMRGGKHERRRLYHRVRHVVRHAERHYRHHE